MTTDESDAMPQVLLDSGERVPEPNDWGFCAYGDAAPAIGGGMPWFYWFATEQEMLAAVNQHAAIMHPPRSDLDPTAIQARVVDILAATPGCPDAATIAHLNEALRGCTGFEWFGSFTQLANGDDEFEKQVRDDFRSRNDAEGDGPIADADLSEFAHFTREYGV